MVGLKWQTGRFWIGQNTPCYDLWFNRQFNAPMQRLAFC